MFGIVWPPPNFQHVALSNMQPTCWIVQHLSFGRAFRLVLKERLSETRKWSVEGGRQENNASFRFNTRRTRFAANVQGKSALFSRESWQFYTISVH